MKLQNKKLPLAKQILTLSSPQYETKCWLLVFYSLLCFVCLYQVIIYQKPVDNDHDDGHYEREDDDVGDGDKEGEDDDHVAGNDRVNGVGSALCFLSALRHPHLMSDPEVQCLPYIDMRETPKSLVQGPTLVFQTLKSCCPKKTCAVCLTFLESPSKLGFCSIPTNSYMDISKLSDFPD